MRTQAQASSNPAARRPIPRITPLQYRYPVDILWVVIAKHFDVIAMKTADVTRISIAIVRGCGSGKDGTEGS
jgi:hypothetical protein